MATKLGQALWHQMQQSWWRSQYLRVSISALWAAQRLQTAYCGRPWGSFMGRRPGHSDKKNWRWVSYKLQGVHRYFSRWMSLGNPLVKAWLSTPFRRNHSLPCVSARWRCRPPQSMRSCDPFQYIEWKAQDSPRSCGQAH